jgi:hypothetical protein
MLGGFPVAPATATQGVDDVHVLILVSDDFGWGYFDANACFQAWGMPVTTAAYGSELNLDSCHNRPPRPIVADVLLSSIGAAQLSQYDILFLPPGPNWAVLVASPDALNFISTAYQQGLVVAAVCIANRVLAGANRIVEGVKVAADAQSDAAMVVAGATIVHGVQVVADRRIITGGAGGGPTGGGVDVAPIAEACAAAVKAALERSFVLSVGIIPSAGTPEAVFTIRMEITNPAAGLSGFNTTHITGVTARIYPQADSSCWAASIQLQDPEADGIYSGSCSGLPVGQYQVVIEIEDDAEVLEVVRNAAVFSVTPSILPVALIAIVGVSVPVAAVVVVALRKRRVKNRLAT